MVTTGQQIPDIRKGFIRRWVEWILSLVAAMFYGAGFAVKWSWLEACYWTRLFWYTSRQFLRLEAYLSILGALVFFGMVFVQNRISNQHQLLYYCYLYFTAVTVLIAMNILPQERERGTLEILWSQPIKRSVLVVVQMLTLSIWIFLLSLFIVIFFGQYAAYLEGRATLIFCVLTTSFLVAVLTLIVSTFCRHGIATGLVALLILGVHFFWLQEIGPIQLYFNPILPPGYRGHDMTSYFIFNRIVVFVLIGFGLDYLFRRLRRTAQWFT